MEVLPMMNSLNSVIYITEVRDNVEYQYPVSMKEYMDFHMKTLDENKGVVGKDFQKKLGEFHLKKGA
jgi:hypothetical protein